MIPAPHPTWPVYSQPCDFPILKLPLPPFRWSQREHRILPRLVTEDSVVPTSRLQGEQAWSDGGRSAARGMRSERREEEEELLLLQMVAMLMLVVVMMRMKRADHFYRLGW